MKLNIQMGKIVMRVAAFAGNKHYWPDRNQTIVFIEVDLNKTMFLTDGPFLASHLRIAGKFPVIECKTYGSRSEYPLVQPTKAVNISVGDVLNGFPRNGGNQQVPIIEDGYLKGCFNATYSEEMTGIWDIGINGRRNGYQASTRFPKELINLDALEAHPFEDHEEFVVQNPLYGEVRHRQYETDFGKLLWAKPMREPTNTNQKLPQLAHMPLGCPLMFELFPHQTVFKANAEALGYEIMNLPHP